MPLDDNSPIQDDNTPISDDNIPIPDDTICPQMMKSYPPDDNTPIPNDNNFSQMITCPSQMIVLLSQMRTSSPR